MGGAPAIFNGPSPVLIECRHAKLVPNALTRARSQREPRAVRSFRSYFKILLGSILAEATNRARFSSKIHESPISVIMMLRVDMRGFYNNAFDPQTLVLLETAFDEAWLTLKSIGIKTVKPDELARCVWRLATEGERTPCDYMIGRSKA
jgi:hypothetical protein